MTADIDTEAAARQQLEALPDGSIIRWLRIPGDPTSEAVAFVRVERELAPEDPSMPNGGPPFTERRVVWISPGGWDPMTVEAAGVTYPVEVIRMGDHTLSDDWPDSEQSLLMEPLTGGTWAREKALECATQWTLSELNSLASVTTVLAIAEQFELWLDRAVTR